MSLLNFRNIIIPQLSASLGYPVIEADHVAEAPEGPHLTYKVTRSYGQDTGMPSTIQEAKEDKLLTHQTENYRATVSFTAYAFDNTEQGIYGIAEDLAQQARDWLDFQGYPILSANEIVIVELTEVQNRDAILVENYERRQGFDAIIRMSRLQTRAEDFFDTAAIEYKEE